MSTRLVNGTGLTLAATLALAACDKAEQQPPPVDNATISNAVEDAASPPASNSAVPDAGTVAPSPTPSADDASGLPAAYLGRWGMAEADCDISRSDTKGLVTVSRDSLKFYESFGKLESMKTVSPIELRASFAFSGEGQNWTKDMTLKLENGGTTLVRVEKEPTATFRHKKCG